MRLLLAIFLTSIANGQFLPGLDPRLPDAKPVESLPETGASGENLAGQGAMLSKRLTQIRLETWTGGKLVDLNESMSASEELLLPAPTKLTKKFRKQIGQPLTEGDLLTIADVILQHYDEHGYPVVLIDAPEQDLQGGVLRFLVEVGRIGKIGVSQPEYGDAGSITKGLSLRRNDVLRRNEIDEQMAWYGRSIFRHPKLFVSPGEQPATADLLIGLAERKPWRATMGYENSGPDLLGRERFFLGAAGMTKKEHIVAFRTVLGTPMSSLQAHALSWEIPFHRLHQSLQLDAAYAEVETFSTLAGLPVENNGTSWTLSAMQKIPLPAFGKWTQKISAGLEVKSTDQFVLFGGGNFSPGELRFVNAKVNYTLSREWDSGNFSMETGLVRSPGGMISNNDDADFQNYDPAADSSYTIGRMSGQGWWTPGGDWRLAMRGSAQVSDSHLLPIEQFAVGGYQTVRGVAEREFFADDGWQSSLEMYTPAVVIGESVQMRFLTFYDQAWLQDKNSGSESLSGAGIGLRLKFSEYLDLRLDHGWRLDEDGSRTHFGLQLAF